VARLTDTVRIEAWQTFLGNTWANKGERLGMGKGSLEISARASGPKQYYEQRQGLNVVGLLSNPMILIGIAGLAMMVGMPKLLESSEFSQLRRRLWAVLTTASGPRNARRVRGTTAQEPHRGWHVGRSKHAEQFRRGGVDGWIQLQARVCRRQWGDWIGGCRRQGEKAGLMEGTAGNIAEENHAYHNRCTFKLGLSACINS
jgi:Protein of unknown function (DUF2012)